MHQAAAILGRPLEELKVAKRAGCPAFRAGRVDLDAFKKWMQDNPDLPGLEGDVDQRIKKAQAEHWELRNATLRGEYTKNVDVERAVARMVSNFKTAALRIPNRAAMPCAGRSAPEIEKILTDIVDGMLHELHSGKWKG